MLDFSISVELDKCKENVIYIAFLYNSSLIVLLISKKNGIIDLVIFGKCFPKYNKKSATFVVTYGKYKK